MITNSCPKYIIWVVDETALQGDIRNPTETIIEMEVKCTDVHSAFICQSLRHL